MAAHRYWRIRFTGPGNQNGDIDLGWVKFFETVDIDATAAASPASVGGTAISGENYSSSYLPAKSFNYSNSEVGAQWATASQATDFSVKWIGYDFGAGNAKDILAYSIAYYSSYEPWQWVLEYSDNGTSWTIRHSVPSFRFNANTSHYFRCPETPAGTAGYRYYRVYGTGSGTVLSIGEIALHATPGGANLIANPYASLYSDSANGNNYSAYGARKALDGTVGFLSNSWRSLANSDPHWWMVDFGKKVEIAEVVMNTGPDGEWRGSTKFQGSNDLSAWDDLGTFAAFTTAYSQQTLSAAPAIITRRRPVIVST